MQVHKDLHYSLHVCMYILYVRTYVRVYTCNDVRTYSMYVQYTVCMYSVLFIHMSFVLWLTCGSMYMPSPRTPQSYTVGETLEFQKVLFDIYGHSPLVQHFLRKKDLMSDVGLALLFKRTEISSPSKKSGSTFQEMATKIDADRKTFEEDFDRFVVEYSRTSQIRPPLGPL